MVTINILNDCNLSAAMAFNMLELHWGYTVITTITTNSFSIIDFKIQALQQYNYNISDFELQNKSVTIPGRQSCNPNPNAAITFQAVSYNSKNRGGTRATGDGSLSIAALAVGRGSRCGSTWLSWVMLV
jgi:hypothetical protein